MISDTQVALGIITVALSFAVYVPYYVTILYGHSRPHAYTYLIGTIVNSSAFLGIWLSGAGAASWNIAASGLLVFGVLLLSLRYGTKDIRPIDSWLLGAALLALIPWLITNDPTVSVVLITLIDSLSMVPTLRKTWNDPTSEPYLIWGLNAIKHSLAILAVSTVSIATVVYPAAMVLMNAVLTIEILYLKHRSGLSKK